MITKNRNTRSVDIHLMEQSILALEKIVDDLLANRNSSVAILAQHVQQIAVLFNRLIPHA